MRSVILLVILASCLLAKSQNLGISIVGRYTDGRDGACEISAYDPTNQLLFVTNAVSDSIDIIDVANPQTPVRTGGINILNYGGGVNSIATLPGGYLVAAIEANSKQDNGRVVIFGQDGTLIQNLEAGALPDMVTVSPDGNTIMVANEGEPNDDYTIDPEGSITLIDISNGVASVNQSDVTQLTFEDAPPTIVGAIQKPGTTWAVDLEPEYISIADDNSIAAVVCQENNVLILVNLATQSIMQYVGLGFKDHSVAGNGMDVSNRDDTVQIQNWPVKGIYQPDAIGSLTIDGAIYWFSANEGDARDYDGYSSEVRVKDLTLDSTAFPNANELQADEQLGRLKTLTADMIGDTDGDGDIDELYSYGARSFSIWDANGQLIWDSGDEFEQYFAANHPNFFNCDDGLADEKDSRSDDKGPEPEALTTAKIGERFYAFIGLERQGGIMIYDVTHPTQPVFEQYITPFNDDGTMTDVAPEGLVFVPAATSGTGTNLLIASHEVSGTVAVYEITDLTATSQHLELEEAISVYPNPSTGLFQVITEMPLQYQITSIAGKVIKEGHTTNNKFIDLANEPSGIYVVKFKNNAQHSFATVQKLIVQ